MTTKLSCRDIELLIVDGEGGELAAEARRLIEDHLRDCRRCQSFAADRSAIRGTFAAERWPAPPERLVRETRRRLVEESSGSREPAFPAWVLAIFALTAAVTGLWLAIALADVGPETALADMPVAGLAAIMVIIQNALMLFLAPIVLKAARSRRGPAAGA